MRIVNQSLALAALASLLVSTGAAAQQGGTGAFRWYVGGHAGVTSFRTVPDGRDLMPVAGAHLLVTAKRTGLLLSVDQGFGSDHSTQTFFQVTDSTNAVVSAGVRNWTFSGIRRYSAVLVAYPVRNPNIQPFVGIGVGIMHTTGNSPGPFADGSVESQLSSAGFGTGIAGLEFRLGPFSAFGQYQVTTKQGFRSVHNTLQTNGSGKVLFAEDDYGEWTQGAFHVLTGGLRFSLGSARESVSGGGY
jgi:hypothetical protein